MKAKWIALWIIIVAVVMAGLLGCKSESKSTRMPPLTSGGKSQSIEVTYQEFLEKKNISQDIEIVYPGSLVVTLASNPTTGFQWGAAKISDTAVLTQSEHNYVAPAAGSPPGASGKDVWTFKPAGRGAAIITIGYSRPWQGGEQNEWTYTLKVTVK
jgi:inhibitor of cysteine peptidase